MTSRCPALSTIRSLGLMGAEINAGGFLPTPHLPVEDCWRSRRARRVPRGVRRGRVELTGLNATAIRCTPTPRSAPRTPRTCAGHPGRGAARRRPGGDHVGPAGGPPRGHWPAWHVNPWDSGYLDSLDYQWDDVAVPFWREIDALARDHDVKVCIEMHPQNLVFNPPTLRRLVEKTGATHVGAEMDPSHLFWQGIDPIAAIDYLGDFGVPRRCQGHPHQPGVRRSMACSTIGSPGLRPKRTRRRSAGGTPSTGGRKTRWDFVARRPRPRRRVLVEVPRCAESGRPRYGGQHRA